MQFPIHNYQFSNGQASTHLHNVAGYLDDNGKSWVEYNGKKYDSLPSFVKDCAFLLDYKNRLKDVATLYLFLDKGIGCQVISDPQGFIQRYQKKISIEKSSSKKSDPLNNASARGQFDLSAIRLPWIEKNNLIFFVEEAMASTPKKATVNVENGSLKLEVLALK